MTEGMAPNLDFEKGPSESRQRLHRLGILQKMELTEPQEALYVIDEKSARRLLDEHDEQGRKTLNHAFRILSDHYDAYHSGEYPQYHCSCPIRGHHDYGKGALFTPDSIEALAQMLAEDPRAMSRCRIWEHGAGNIIEAARIIKEGGELRETV